MRAESILSLPCHAGCIGLPSPDDRHTQIAAFCFRPAKTVAQAAAAQVIRADLARRRAHGALLSPRPVSVFASALTTAAAVAAGWGLAGRARAGVGSPGRPWRWG